MGSLSISGTGLTPAQLSKLKSQIQSGGVVDINFSELLKQYSGTNNVSSSGASNPLVSMMKNLTNSMLQGIKGNQPTEGTQDTAATQSAQATDSDTVDTDAINRTKQTLNQEFASYKKIGITVSDWDANNSCTLSVNGKTATVTIDNSGNLQFSGDMEAIAKYIEENDPNEKASVENQNAFIQAQQAAGDPVVGDVKPTTVKVGGKDVAVNEYTTQSGKKYYLDGSGNQVTPDVTTDIT